MDFDVRPAATSDGRRSFRPIPDFA